MIDAALQVFPYDKWGEESIWKQRARTTEANEYANVLTRYFSNPQTIPSFFNLFPPYSPISSIAQELQNSLSGAYIYFGMVGRKIFFIFGSPGTKNIFIVPLAIEVLYHIFGILVFLLDLDFQ